MRTFKKWLTLGLKNGRTLGLCTTMPGKPETISLASSVNQARLALGRAPGRKQVPGGLKIALLYLSKGLLTHGIIVIGFAAAAPFQDEGAQCLECTLHILVE